jgi:hypothetical protein
MGSAATHIAETFIVVRDDSIICLIDTEILVVEMLAHAFLELFLAVEAGLPVDANDLHSN